MLGARTGTAPNKQAYSLREHGVRDGLFHAGGSGDVAYLTEGYSCKALAIASLGLGRVYGGGGLHRARLCGAAGTHGGARARPGAGTGQMDCGRQGAPARSA